MREKEREREICINTSLKLLVCIPDLDAQRRQLRLTGSQEYSPGNNTSLFLPINIDTLFSPDIDTALRLHNCQVQ